MKNLNAKISLAIATVLMANNTLMAQTAPAAGQQPSMWEAMFPFVIMFVILYFLMLRPQMKKQKEQQNFITNLKKGDEVLTQSGILGKIDGLTDQFVTLEIANDVKIKMLRAQIAGSSQTVIQAAQKDSSKK